MTDDGDFFDDYDDALHQAAQDNDVLSVKKLLADGSDPNVFDFIAKTPLHWAASKGNAEIVHLLLSAGADVNAHDAEGCGETPLTEAACSGSLKVAKMLLKAGGDPFIAGWMGLDALDRARDRKSEEGKAIYELLKEMTDPVKRTKIQKKSKRTRG